MNLLTVTVSSTLASRRLRLELQALSVVLSDPERAMPVAESVGLSAKHFSFWDARLIFCAASVMRTAPVVDVLRLAKRALIADHHWGGTNSMIASGCQWNDAELIALADGWFFSESIVKTAALRLVEFTIGEQQIQGLEDQLVRATSSMLRGGINDDSPALSPRPSNVMIQLARHQGAA